jgi:hypothetical protein
MTNGADWGEATQTVKPARQRAKMMGISFVKLFPKKARRPRILFDVRTAFL